MISIKKINFTKIFYIFLSLVLVFFLTFSFIKSRKSESQYPELSYLNKKELDFKGLDNYFKDLSLKKGAEYAFNVLRLTDLPPNTDVHLLAHTVGNILYKQKGMEGIKICTDDFRNACSHTVVIGIFIDKGIDAITEIADVCRKAPGGTGAYGMCFHGLGHGVLAYSGYNMIESIDLCKKAGSLEFNYIESSECIGGVVMEMINGVHDPVAWAREKDKYLKVSDPLYPCNQDFIPDAAKNNCFWYLTPHFWEVAGGDINLPTDKDFEKAFPYCEGLKGEQKVYQEACYGGFGKEFVALASSKDIRRVDSMTEPELNQVYKWCLLAKVKEGSKACISQAINAVYWGGENKTDSAVLFCSLMSDPEYKDMCFNHLIGAFRFYKSGTALIRDCNSLPAVYAKMCLST